MTSLNSVSIGHNKYCGPAVLSILTGRSTDECARVISSINGKYTIEGVELKHLLTAAKRLGFDCEAINPAVSLFGTLTRLANNDGLYIVTVTGHFIAIEVNNKNIYFCDNHTKEPMPAASSARLQQRVAAVHKVVKRREPLLLSTKLVVNKSYTDSGIEVRVSQHTTYDIERYNSIVAIARLKFASKQDLDDFTKSLMEE